jgi:hypothetical protein
LRINCQREFRKRKTRGKEEKNKEQQSKLSAKPGRGKEKAEGARALHSEHHDHPEQARFAALEAVPHACGVDSCQLHQEPFGRILPQ